MGRGDSAGDFDPSENMEDAGILDVFPVFHAARLGQKIRRSPPLPLCGVSGHGLQTGKETPDSDLENTDNSHLTLDGWTYGQSANEPSATAAYGTIQYTDSTSEGGPYSSTKPTEAGTYYVKATVEGVTCYDAVSQTLSFPIGRATPSISTRPTASAIPYGQSLASSILTGGAAKNPYNQMGVPGTFAWMNSSQTPAECGSVSCTVTFTPKDTRIYSSTSTQIPLTVKKATPDAPGAGDGYAIDYAGETITIGDGYEVFTAQNGGTFAGLTAGQTYTVYTRVKATGSSFASVSSRLPVTTKTSAAAAPGVSGSYAVSTTDGSKPFDGTTTAKWKGTPSLSGVVDPDQVTLVNGTPFFESDAVGVRTVKFTYFSLDG